jgi:hypothetical protein
MLLVSENFLSTNHTTKSLITPSVLENVTDEYLCFRHPVHKMSDTVCERVAKYVPKSLK